MNPYKYPRVVDLLSDGQHEQHPQKTLNNGFHSTYSTKKQLSDQIHPSQKIQQKISQYQNRTKQTLEIYQFLRQNNILGSNNPNKLSKCKICTRKVESNNNKFKCQNCQKSCHISCMQDPHQCPRCSYNDHLKIINKPNLNLRNFVASQKVQKKSLFIKQQKRDEKLEPTTRAPQKCVKQNVLDTRSLPKQLHQQALSFTRKYYKYLNEDGDIELPIQDNLINEYKFIQHLLSQKTRNITEFQPLPEYFSNLVEVWNFFSNLETIIKPRQVCSYSLQIFQEVVKNKQISYFITPIIQLLYQLGAKSNSNSTNIFKIFENLNQNDMLKYVSKYFWTSIILQYESNHRVRQTQSGENQKKQKFLQKLRKMQQSRIYQVTQFSQKIEILKFLVAFTQKSSFFRNSVNEYIRLRAEQATKAGYELERQKEKLKQQQQQNAQKHVKIVEKASELKIQAAGGEKKQGLKQKLLQLQEERKKVMEQQQQISQQLKQLKQDSQVLGHLSELRYCNKIFYLGKDRRGYMYWFIDDTQATNIVFVNQLTRNQSDQVIQDKWGFYHGNKLQQLISSLNMAGINQRKLRMNIEKLINLKLIQINAYRRISRVRQILKNIRNQSQEEEEENQNFQVQAFLKNNVKQINLSELRKLLIESLRVFNIFVKKYRGIWEVNEAYEYRTKNQRFKNLNEIKQFVIQFGTDMYCLKQSSKCKKSRGRQKRGSQLWVNRPQAYTAWKKALQSSNKNSQVFMLVLVLYIEVVFSAGGKKAKKKVQNQQMKPKLKAQKRSESSKSSKSQSAAQQSWSGSRDQLMQKSNQQSSS